MDGVCEVWILMGLKGLAIGKSGGVGVGWLGGGAGTVEGMKHRCGSWRSGESGGGMDVVDVVDVVEL